MKSRKEVEEDPGWLPLDPAVLPLSFFSMRSFFTFSVIIILNSRIASSVDMISFYCWFLASKERRTPRFDRFVKSARSWSEANWIGVVGTKLKSVCVAPSSLGYLLVPASSILMSYPIILICTFFESSVSAM